MKQLAIILAVVLLILLAVCFFRPTPAGTEPTKNQLQSNQSGSQEPIQTNPGTTQTPHGTSLPTETPQTQPAQTEPVKPEPADTDFVKITDFVPSVLVRLPYATTENFTGTVIYDFTDAYLRYGTVKKLAQAAQLLSGLGYGILVWDGYRPVYAQQKLWDICPDPTYVSKPGTGSQSHCRGIAVDITLYDLQSGQLLEMPTDFDDFSEMADRDYSDCTDAAGQNALLLETIMEQCGFKPYSGEWWHFSDTDPYDIEYHFDPALD